jgi:hypothetical protein
MSHTVEVCFNHNGTLEELRARIEEVLGVQFTYSERSTKNLQAYYGKLLTIDIELSVNYLETDRELNFSDFRYVLATRVAGHACAQRLLELQIPLTDTLGLLLSYYLRVEVMVTADAERLLARYHPDRLQCVPQHRD